MNFEIHHNKTKINEAADFDMLAANLVAYRKAGYSNITVFHPSLKGTRIDNIPTTGTQTGFISFDIYGCWYEVTPDDGSDNFLMIGEYPYTL